MHTMEVSLSESLLDADNLSYSVTPPSRSGLLSNAIHKAAQIELLKNVNLRIGKGETLGLVGESGSGKTTLGRCLIRILEPTTGRLRFDGIDITHASLPTLKPHRAHMQMIFQDPQSSLNPRRRVGATITQPLLTFKTVSGKKQARAHAIELLERVGLDRSIINRFPFELSGGQRQRIGIARAIALRPKLIVADEIVSGLDVSSQAQILTLLTELKSELNLALVFISHDLSVVRSICDRLLVMKQGKIIESNDTDQLFDFRDTPILENLSRQSRFPNVRMTGFRTILTILAVILVEDLQCKSRIQPHWLQVLIVA